MGSIAPNYGGIGPNAAGTWTISGTGFSTTPKGTRFGTGTSAADFVDVFTGVSCSITTSCTASIRPDRVAPGSYATLSIKALVAGSISASGYPFLYYGSPVITSIIPNSGPWNAATPYVISGGPLASNASFPSFPGGLTSIYLENSIVDTSGCASVSSCNATAPSLTYDCCVLQGAKAISIRTPGGSPSNVYFAYGGTPATPTVVSVSPPSGSPAGGQTVTITGTNFIQGVNSPSGGGFGATLGTSFNFMGPNGSGGLATNVNCSSTTTCTVVVPALGPGGPVDVQVFTVCPYPNSVLCGSSNARPSGSIPTTKVGAYTATGIKVSPGVPGSPATLYTSESGQSTQFMVALQTQPTSSVHVALSFTTNPAPAVLSTTGLDFTTGNWSVPQTVTVTGVDDDGVIGHPSQTTGITPYSLNIQATSADANYNNLFGTSPSFTNIDNESKNFFISPQTGLVTTRSGGKTWFTVFLSRAPSATVTLALTSSDPGEGAVSPSSLTFTTTPGGANGWNVPRTVTVTGVNSATAPRDIDYSILLNFTSADSTYGNINNLNQPDVAVTNRNAPGVVLAPSIVSGTASTSTSVDVDWPPSVGATMYEVERNAGAGFMSLGTVPNPPFRDNTATPNTSYLYRVRAVLPSTTGYAGPDLATTVIYANAVINSTLPISSADFTELQTAANAVSVLAGLGVHAFTPLAPGMPVLAANLIEIRNVLNPARSTLGLAPAVYLHPTLTPNSTPISASDVTDVRNGVR